MLTILLVESELEIIPEQIRTHPHIITSARRRRKKPDEILLDSSTHHSAMTNLVEKERRGRPDIIHLFLLIALESIVNKQKHLQIMIHTRNDEVIIIDPTTRMIKNYDRFLGLMETLFKNQVVPDKNHPLLTLKKCVPLPELLNTMPCDCIIACSSTGKPVKLSQYFTELKQRKHQNLVFLIGGFPNGEFHTDLSHITNEIISIYPEMVLAWTVASELLVNYENTFL